MGSPCVLLCAFLCVLAQPSSASPTRTEKMLGNVKLLAKITIVRIQSLRQQLRPSPSMTIGGLEPLFEKLSLRRQDNVCKVIEGLHCYRLMLRSLGLASTAQVQTDLGNMQNALNSVSQNCGRPQCRITQQIQDFIQRNSSYKVTISRVVSDRLRRYLENLARALDNRTLSMS